MLILGIESSCDETAAAVVKDGTHILSSVISSQIDVHSRYGGVVPELASRMHIEAVHPVVSSALEQAGVTPGDLDGIAATRGPGLIGALLVGFCYAKAFALARDLPLAGVNHLHAHIYSLFLEEDHPEFPFIALVVSGGHTNIYHVRSHKEFILMGQTRDDAAGEAFDKIAKMLDLGYPGGPIIEKLANQGQPLKEKFPRTLLEKDSFDFSFSGLKSSVLRYLTTHPVRSDTDKMNIAASFQEAVIDVLTTKLIRAAAHQQCGRIAITGGVSANRTFAEHLSREAKSRGIKVYAPSPGLCTDNGAMIAARGFHMLRNNDLCEHDADVFSREKTA
ncbi:MAG: tRNA (adenosine(37)-N6)-threonylcarbamoyltransferase complex transferase subunit TsaD [Desulfobacteraceae bacterium]|nr:MAG: tRNA (adenosine(37)-N6)-threonylcarbamoyltransferase complex transferase subunit TsaD [Desulfobacteraceae bacterium]